MKNHKILIKILMVLFVLVLTGCNVNKNTNDDVQTNITTEDLKSKKQEKNEESTIVVNSKLKTIAVGFEHSVGLKSDGTVLAVGENESGQCNVGNWTDIVEIAAGSEFTAGLRSNGTIITTDAEINSRIETWTDIESISAYGGEIVGLKTDGTALSSGYDEIVVNEISTWTDLVDIQVGYAHTVGLKSDGTVIAVGDNRFGQCDVSEWTNIVSILVGDTYTVGLKSDGTVNAVGNNRFGQCNVEDWNDIVAVFDGGTTVGLTAQGTLNLPDTDGVEIFEWIKPLEKWTNIVDIASGDCYIIGVKSDGSVIVSADSRYENESCCNVDDWNLFE